eukprot:scaffold106020_cov28-Tisochrysis_lutea.AAC.2
MARREHSRRLHTGELAWLQAQRGMWAHESKHRGSQFRQVAWLLRAGCRLPPERRAATSAPPTPHGRTSPAVGWRAGQRL